MAKFRLGLAAIVFIFLFVGCREEKPYLKFNHDVHSQVASDLTCDNCHALQEGKYLLPTHENCADCHEEVSGKPSEKCLKCHYKPEPKHPTRVFTRTYQDIKFDHTKHTQLTCSSCHPALKTRLALPKMEQCFNCHKDLESKSQCRACHSMVEKDVRPTTHNLAFYRNHSNGNASRCAMCHGHNACDDCHHNKRPYFHTAGWDKDFHGKEAIKDRKRCAYCHEGTFCDRCHSEKPYTHYVANWENGGHATVASTNRRSCVTCHKVEFCAQCHRGKGFFPYKK